MEEEAREKFWQRKRGAMKEPRRLYREFMRAGRTKADGSMMLVSPHLSMIGRYWPWFPPLALWHAWRMSVHAKRASLYVMNMNPNDLDVLSRAFFKAPWPWRDLDRAVVCIETALYKRDSGKAGNTPVHTWALLLMTRAEIYLYEGQLAEAREFFTMASDLLPDIESDTVPDRMKQYARVAADAGFFFLRSGETSNRDMGYKLLSKALRVARTESKDQHLKISRGCELLGIDPLLLEG